MKNYDKEIIERVESLGLDKDYMRFDDVVRDVERGALSIDQAVMRLQKRLKLINKIIKNIDKQYFATIHHYENVDD